ncbi:MAG: hypothetical protein A2Y33_16080 [Spirochaetes bacterium GWF1_51_8]|nr:MAG: hypothetical protein A2Y33_16080 [Spirochaetes bacterium GWF1_51_8]
MPVAISSLDTYRRKRNVFYKFLIIIFLFFNLACSNSSVIKNNDDAAYQIINTLCKSISPSSGVIAVAHFVSYNDKDTSIIAIDFSDKLINYLRNKGYKVVENAQLNTLVKEQKLAMAGVINSEYLDKIGKMTGADYILLGTVSKIKGEISINARLVNIYTREILSASSTSYPISDNKKDNQNDNNNVKNNSVISSLNVIYPYETILFWYSYINVGLSLNTIGFGYIGEVLDFQFVLFKKIGLGISCIQINYNNLGSGVSFNQGIGVIKLALPLYINPGRYNFNNYFLEFEVGLFDNPYFDFHFAYRIKGTLEYFNTPIYFSLGFRYFFVDNFQSQWCIYINANIGFGDYKYFNSLNDILGIE